MLTDVNGTELWHTEVGAGPPCLVIHGGLGFDHTLYRSLDPLASTAQLILYDQREHGRSGRPGVETITMEQLADDAAGLVAQLGHESVIALGHSYGGFVAQELAIRHPALLRGLILVGTTPGQLGTTEDPSDEQGPPPPPELLEVMASFPASDEEFAAFVPRMVQLYLHRAQATDVMPYLADAILNRESMIRGFQILPAWSSVDRLPEISCPTLVIVGRHDPVTSWPQAYRISRRIAGADTVILEDSGHLPWIDEPEQFFRTTSAWIAGLPAAETG